MTELAVSSPERTTVDGSAASRGAGAPDAGLRAVGAPRGPKHRSSRVYARDAASELERPGGASWIEQAVLVAGLVFAASWLLAAVPTPSLRVLFSSHMPVWVPASAILFWRWSWTVVHWTRALVYRFWVYPRMRAEAERAVAQRGGVPEVAVVLATFKERPEVTHRVVTSVLDELRDLEGLHRLPLLIAITGSNEDDQAIRDACAAHAKAWGRFCAELVLLRGADGKRKALGAGLRHLHARGLHPDGVFVMMDGDTRLEPGALKRALPLFRLDPPVYALTTNEHARVQAPSWFSEWIHMRHGQRHIYNCSLALSDKLLCLTGRYSLFRGAALDEGFIDIVTNDTVDHWLWGRYLLLSGDDKSTWFYLLSQGKRLLYAPDVAVVTYEAVTGSCLVRAYHNLRRWGGNMMRNSQRAISLGPGKLGLFCWWCLIDQRISIWTTLIGPTAALYMLERGRPDLVAAYFLWVLCSRLVRSVPSWLHGRRVSFFYAPVAVFSDWAGALVKLWVIAFPARQFWHNRGGRELDSTRGNARVRDRKILAGAMLITRVCLYVLLVGQLIGAIALKPELVRILRAMRESPLPTVSAAAAVLVLSAVIVLRVRPEEPASAKKDG
jgi:glycosyltransferase Alg8